MEIYISVIVPLFNEAANVGPLHERLRSVLDSLDRKSEIILINDGSTDGTRDVADGLADRDPDVKVIHLKTNSGQTAAMMAGFDHASGKVLVPMDGDLQNDPSDIPRLLAKLEEGFDVCSGWRKHRKDHRLRRNLPSRVANWIISKVTGLKLHDYGCSLKAYRADILKGIKLYGEMHRFIPIYAQWQGAKVCEIEVGHGPRIHGKSKYGLERTLKVILDLITIKFLSRYGQKPMYVFGSFGVALVALSVFSFLVMIAFKYLGGKSFIETPLPLLTVFLFLLGFQSILMGVLAEMIMRTYFESQNKRSYLIDRTRNLDMD